MIKSLIYLTALLSALLFLPIAVSFASSDPHNPLLGACVDCHADDEPHDGEFGQNCASCHQPTGWEKEDFDHGLSRFPLIGLHTEVSCDSCHDQIEGNGSAVSCKNCHADDEPHDGEFGQNCASCHQPTGWEKEDFDHGLSRFPLIGLHTEVSCDSCHDQIEIASSPVTCKNCHADDEPHDGEFGQNCASCHQPTGWEKEDFDHGLSRFPLIGLHTEVSCDSCHDQIEGDGSPVSCKNCHADDEPHDGEFGQNCASCHQPTGWEKEDFDHGLSRFPLIGLHIEVSCDSCHDQIEIASSPVTCKNCHVSEDPHDQKRGLNCARCHNPNGWDLWQFDHQIETDFSLEGVHQNLECLACHKESIQEFRISKNCFACHSKDDQHQGRFGRNCDRCHQPTNFKDVRISN